MKYFSIPFYRFQYVAFRVANKLGLASYFTPIYQNREEKHKEKVVRFAIEKRFQKTYHENLFLSQLISFYHLYESNQDWETVEIPPALPIYLGSDMEGVS